MRRVAFVFCIIFAALPGAPLFAQSRTQNVVLVTLDGFRWQELFGGADSTLLRDRRAVRDTAASRARFWFSTADERRSRLLPFVWSVIARHGQIYQGVQVTNPHRFSYPGYSELLTGTVDPRIDSNDKVPNPNKTILELLNERRDFRGRVAAFASWDVFPFIINAERSGVPVNAGPVPGGHAPTDRLLQLMPTPWAGVRWDAFTYEYAFQYLKQKRPRVLYIAFDETDDFAHDGRYDAYLDAAQRTDGFLRELWEWVQATPGYRDRTTLIVTSDHGRGNGAEWRNHGAETVGAEVIWLAIMGPDTPARGVIAEEKVTQNQIAATIARLLGR